MVMLVGGRGKWHLLATLFSEESVNMLRSQYKQMSPVLSPLLYKLKFFMLLLHAGCCLFKGRDLAITHSPSSHNTESPTSKALGSRPHRFYKLIASMVFEAKEYGN